MGDARAVASCGTGRGLRMLVAAGERAPPPLRRRRWHRTCGSGRVLSLIVSGA